MSNFTFRPAERNNAGLLIGLAGGTGSGKTFTALRLAQGMVGRDKAFAVVDTEHGRASHYAPAPGEQPDFKTTFRFDSGELHSPYRPSAYEEAILAADAAGYPVIVVDSMSHEHAGEGGLLDWHEAEFQRMGARETVKVAAWIKPKTAHKHMVQKLLQVRAHLILCFRAEEKIEMVKGDDGKMKVVAKRSRIGKDGWIPICEKNLPFELTASFLLTDERPGVPLPIKLQEQHRALFPLDKPITEESGRQIAAWASGGKESAPPSTPTAAPPSAGTAGADPGWAALLNAAPTVRELGEVWAQIPKADKERYAAAKDARKAELSKPAGQSNEEFIKGME